MDEDVPLLMPDVRKQVGGSSEAVWQGRFATIGGRSAERLLCAIHLGDKDQALGPQSRRGNAEQSILRCVEGPACADADGDGRRAMAHPGRI